MRPTVTEQLRGLGTILETVVVPEVHTPYASDMLSMVIDTLRRLEREWVGVLRAMRDECGAIDGLLREARPLVSNELRGGLDAALARDAPDWLDHDASIVWYEERRGLLADVVRDRDIGAAPDDLQRSIAQYLRAYVSSR